MTAPRLVAIGRVTKPHGLKGEVVLAGTPLSPEVLEGLGALEGRDAKGGVRPLTIVAARPFMQNVLVRFEGIADVDAARELAGLDLEVDPARLPRPEAGEVYIYQLIGLAVSTEQGEALGTVKDVMRTGAAPILVVRGDGRERLLPMSPEVLLEVDVTGGRVVVRLLPGMEDL